jgi:response regulator RpfG family c-di-GMP phosphodiesterase
MLPSSQHPWQILIVDDEKGLHDVTKLICRRMEFKHRPVELISAYSATEALEILGKTEDVAVCLIDVVMENDLAGLDLVRDIRENLPQHQNMRLILRTGNPGMAPQREVIQHYDIDDYREKTELTADRLFTSVYTAIRSYETLKTLSNTVTGLEHIISSKSEFLDESDILELMRSFVTQIKQIVNQMNARFDFPDGFIIERKTKSTEVVQAWGEYKSFEGQPLTNIPAQGPISLVLKNIANNTFQLSEHGIVLSLSGQLEQGFVLWIKTNSRLDAHTLHILNLFLQKLLLNIENNKLQTELLNAHQTALNKLCEAVEMRSKETGQHIFRMAKYSRLLAKLSGLPTREVNLIEATAPLHDIGKIAIPDAILNKPGKLTDAEMMEMQRHAQYGYDMLADSNSEMLKLGALVALTHHERWDGTGYPKQLSGENIPLAGRIVSLADVFDALMSRRSYKEPFTFDRTMEIIKEGAGKHFDPALVALLIQHADEFNQIFMDNPDYPVAMVA